MLSNIRRRRGAGGRRDVTFFSPPGGCSSKYQEPNHKYHFSIRNDSRLTSPPSKYPYAVRTADGATDSKYPFSQKRHNNRIVSGERQASYLVERSEKPRYHGAAEA